MRLKFNGEPNSGAILKACHRGRRGTNKKPLTSSSQRFQSVESKEMVPTSSSGAEEKYIEILPVKNDIEGGEFLVDLDSVTNMTCYAMQIHPSLIGAVPGKSSGSLSGTDKRELFLMKQALLKPVVNRCLKPLEVVRRVNGWDPAISIQIPEYIFTTLDQNKSGKEESTNTEI